MKTGDRVYAVEFTHAGGASSCRVRRADLGIGTIRERDEWGHWYISWSCGVSGSGWRDYDLELATV